MNPDASPFPTRVPFPDRQTEASSRFPFLDSVSFPDSMHRLIRRQAMIAPSGAEPRFVPRAIEERPCGSGQRPVVDAPALEQSLAAEGIALAEVHFAGIPLSVQESFFQLHGRRMSGVMRPANRRSFRA